MVIVRVRSLMASKKSQEEGEVGGDGYRGSMLGKCEIGHVEPGIPLFNHGAKRMTTRHKILNGYLSWYRERANRVFVEMSVPSGWGHRVLFSMWGWTVFCVYPRDWAQIDDELWL